MKSQSQRVHTLERDDRARSHAVTSTPMVGDYLKAIYLLQQRDAEVSISRLAAHMGRHASATSTMVQRLTKRDLVAHKLYQGIRLTAAGEQAARTLIRTHRLIETLLVETFGYRWDEVHAEAEALEHHISPCLIERIAAFLGHPTSDPHGDPIPLSDGSIPEQHTVCLADAPLATPLRVVRVLYQDAARLCYLNDLAIALGTMLEVRARAPFDGPLQLLVAAQPHILDYQFAKHILVTIA
jgi:DtxR family transcriptional regulator, Mn-dependent transcriptional regulator